MTREMSKQMLHTAETKVFRGITVTEDAGHDHASPQIK